jgi:hypothetical protein
MHMPNRTAKFASAKFAGFLAGVLLAVTAHGAARAADDCLTAPNDETPGGRHWYYRIDHATKRHCWYLREEGEKLSQTAVPNAARSAKPVEPKADPPSQRSVEDAHAELPPQARIAPPSFNGTLTPADTAARENNWPPVVPGVSAERSVVLSRWPQSSSVASAVNPQPESSDPAASTPPNPPTAGASAIATVPTVPAVSSSPAKTGSIPKLLSAVSGALALAGITASVVLKLAGPRQTRVRVRRDAVWDSTDDDRIVLWADQDQDVLPRRAGFARDFDRSGDANDRISEFCSQLSRRAPT